MPLSKWSSLTAIASLKQMEYHTEFSSELLAFCPNLQRHFLIGRGTSAIPVKGSLHNIFATPL